MTRTVLYVLGGLAIVGVLYMYWRSRQPLAGTTGSGGELRPGTAPPASTAEPSGIATILPNSAFTNVGNLGVRANMGVGIDAFVNAIGQARAMTELIGARQNQDPYARTSG